MTDAELITKAAEHQRLIRKASTYRNARFPQEYEAQKCEEAAAKIESEFQHADADICDYL